MFSLFSVARAASDTTEAVAQQAGFSTSPDLISIIGLIISLILGLLGVVFLILTIYAGWLWMTAQGDPKKVEKARDILMNGVIGLLIILAAYGITTWVVNVLTGGSGAGGSDDGSNNGRVSTEYLSSALGSGVIRDHYPTRNQTEVPRNANIIVTFQEPMDVSSFVVDDTSTELLLDTDNVKIYVTAQGTEAALTDVRVAFSEDLHTFVFDPVDYLGSSTEDVSYTVFLGQDIQNTAGQKILSADGGYQWSFQTGTVVDLTPPTLVSVIPVGGGSYAKNIAVQLTFDEPVDPTTATGTSSANGSGFSSIGIVGSASGAVAGTYSIANGYTTVTFLTDVTCGTNSCGEVVYCLPGDQQITGTVYAADVDIQAPQAIVPYNGIVDLSGNAFDGDGDGRAGDDYSWTFATTGDINLSGPSLTSVTPNIQEEHVGLDQDVTLLFDDILLVSTIDSESLQLDNISTLGEVHDLWYRFDTTFLTPDGSLASSSTTAATQTMVTIFHGTFLESSDEQTWLYGVNVTQDVRNQYQNCYVPAAGPTQDGGTCAVSSVQPYCCNGAPSSSACNVLGS